MPRARTVRVSGGDRDGLLRFAVIARCAQAAARGEALRIPAGLDRSPTWFTRNLFESARFLPTDDTGSKAVQAGLELLQATDAAAPPGWPAVRDLRDRFLAAQHPRQVIAGVDPSWWPELRHIPNARSPIDVLIAGRAAAAYLFELDDRGRARELQDSVALSRVERPLCWLSTRGTRWSNQAGAILGVLCRWQADTVLDQFRSDPFGRKLGRPLDRALRDPGTRPEVRAKITEAALKALAQTPTSTNSAAQVLRLARAVALTDADSLPSVYRGLQAVALGTTGTTDTAVRRLALWYLVEMAPAVAVPAPPAATTSQGRPPGTPPPMPLLPLEQVISAVRDPSSPWPWRGEPPSMLPVEDIVASVPLIGPDAEAFMAAAPRSPAMTHPNLAADPRLNARTWLPGDPTVETLLDDHLPLHHRPHRAFWRALPALVANPTRDLVREAVLHPCAIRARDITDALRVAGDAVGLVTASALSSLVADAAHEPAAVAVAKRATWMLGFLRSASTDLDLLIDLAIDDSIPDELRADAAWAIGDLTSAHPTAPAVVRAVHELVALLGRMGHDPEDLPFQTAQAALHTLAVLRIPQLAPLYDEVHRLAPRLDDPEAARLRRLAEWAVQLLDASLGMPTPTTWLTISAGQQLTPRRRRRRRSTRQPPATTDRASDRRTP